MIFKPHNYQQYCAERIVEDKNVGLFIDMGLGKTASTLLAINELMYNRFEVGAVLVIAPKKVAEATWQNEIKKWDNRRTFTLSTVTTWHGWLITACLSCTHGSLIWLFSMRAAVSRTRERSDSNHSRASSRPYSA